MTKDWEAARPHIKQLSVDQRKSLQEVKLAMEKNFKFRASYVVPSPDCLRMLSRADEDGRTRAYRMKLKEWGYLRHRPRRAANGHSTGGIDRDAASGKEVETVAESESDSDCESDRSATAVEDMNTAGIASIAEVTASAEGTASRGDIGYMGSTTNMAITFMEEPLAQVLPVCSAECER